MTNDSRARKPHLGQGRLAAARAWFVIAILAAGLGLAYLPGHPGTASAESAWLLDASPSVIPTADPIAEPTAGPTEQPTPETSPLPDEPVLDGSPPPSSAPDASDEPPATSDPTASEQPGTPPPSSEPDQPALRVGHVTAARITRTGDSAHYLPIDAPLLDEPRYEVFRLRFEVTNSTDLEQPWTPTLEVAAAGSASFRALPAMSPVAGQPFFAAPEWVPDGAGGTRPGPRFTTDPDGSGQPVLARSMGINPMSELLVPPRATVAVEFSVRATVDAEYQAAYEFRLANGAEPIAGALAGVRLEARPAVVLSAGQRSGIDTASAGRRPRYGLVTTGGGVHDASYSLTSSTCAACHRAHSAPGSMITAGSTQLGLCSSCHIGTDLPDIVTAYASAPDNDASSRSYFQHDPTGAATELGERTSCSDCHNPHDLSADAASQTAAGWTASGRLTATGVDVSYGPGAPAYALVNRPTLEYELCFKCHSGYASLPSNSGQPASRAVLDKGIEFDPRNASYHPVEAAGTNRTDQMTASLDGTSPYKLWQFSPLSTVRCVNCHADARIAQAALDASEALDPASSLAVHASTQRGILIAPYLDRQLKGPLEPYQAADFALCYVCHAEAPFRDTSGVQRDDTNFRYHGLHVSGTPLVNHGNDGTDIDLPGDGGGLATCAECHFRIHSTAFPVNGQPAGPRLVDFAPNVSGGSTTANWSPLTDTDPGTCALKCHGQPHSYTY